MRQSYLVLLALIVGAASAEAQQTIFFRKDHVYVNGKEVAILSPAPADQTAPTAPAGLTSSNLTATSIQLSWTASTDSGGSGLAGYKVYRQQGTGANLPVGTVGPATLTFVDQPLVPSTSLSYSVIAFDNAQNHSAPSAVVTITTASSTGDVTAPSIPVNLVGYGVGYSSVRLTWNASTDSGGSGVRGYKVYRAGTLVSGASPLTSPTFTDTGLDPSAQYSYTLTAEDNVGNVSAASAAATVGPILQTVFSDDFNRADTGSGLNNSSSWFSSGCFHISSNTARVDTSCGSGSALSVTTLGNFKASLALWRSYVAKGVDFWTDGTFGYRVYYSNQTTLVLQYFSPSSTLVLGNTTVGDSVDGVPLVVQATSGTRNIKVWFNGSLIFDFTETDTTRPVTGSIGMYGPNGVVIIDNFVLQTWGGSGS